MIYNRRSLRLPGYDYSQPGAYFVTICVQHREARFGNIARDEMIIDDAGNMVYAEGQRLPAWFATMELDAVVVMPNHLHAIVRIVDPTEVGEIRVVVSQRAGTSPPLRTKRRSRRYRIWSARSNRLRQTNIFGV